ncbi:MAG TPA: AI-2E family transporter, partial [Streptosporangiaceae bacterium]
MTEHRAAAGRQPASTAPAGSGPAGSGPADSGPAGSGPEGSDATGSDTQDGTRRARLWVAAEVRGVPLRAILATVAVVLIVYLAAKVVYRLREVILLLVVSGFVALLLNPLVAALQRRVRRRGLAVAAVTALAVLVFAGLAAAFGYPLVNGMTHLAADLPAYVSRAEHGKGWIGHLVIRYHVQAWAVSNAPKLAGYAKNLANPVLSVGKGAISLVIQLLTIFVLV